MWNRFINTLLGTRQENQPMRAEEVCEEEVKSQLDLKRWIVFEFLERRKGVSGSRDTRNKGMTT